MAARWDIPGDPDIVQHSVRRGTALGRDDFCRCNASYGPVKWTCDSGGGLRIDNAGGASDFGRVVQACESLGSYCLIGGLAVNTYVDPVYTPDADIVMIASSLPQLTIKLHEQDFVIERQAHSVNGQSAGSDLRIRFTTDDRYQEFPSRAIHATVLGLQVRVACLGDVTRGKLWDYSDPARFLSKRKKDELDLIRLGEAYPKLRSLFPAELRQQLEAE